MKTVMYIAHEVKFICMVSYRILLRDFNYGGPFSGMRGYTYIDGIAVITPKVGKYIGQRVYPTP